MVYLLSSGARIGSKGSQGQTALHDAAKCGFTELCELLKSHGADIHARDKEGENRSALRM